MRATFAIVIFACCQSVVGQSPLAIQWKTEKSVYRLNNDPVYAKVAIDPQTNILRVIQAGYTPDFTVSKFSISGQLLFEKKWSIPQPNLNSFFAQTFSVDHDGNSILLIVENNYSPHEGVLHYVSFDPNGTLRWDKNESIPYDVNMPWFVGAAIDNQNNIFFAGTISNRLVAQKISPTGDLVWRQAFEDPDVQYSRAHDIAVDAAGRCYVVGGCDSSTRRRGLFLKFDDTGSVEFWTDPSPRYEFSYELYNLRITENGAFYVTDESSIFRVSADGRTEWSQPADSATFPYLIAPMGDEKVGMVAPDGFNIWDKTGKALGSGRFTSAYAAQDAEGKGESFFMTRVGRISEVRPDGSLVADVNFEDGGGIDIAATEKLDVAFTGLKSATNGSFVFTGLLTHPASTDFPRIIEQPKGGIIVAGSDFTASVGASGPNLRYQWFFSPSPSSQSALDGQTNSTLQLTNLQVYQSGKYSVEVSNGFGKVSSAYADLGVHLIPKFTVNLATIPSRPYLGDKVIWTYRASYTSPAGAQWYKDGIPIPGATNFGYAIPVCSVADLGKYSVLITNLVGEAKSEEVNFPKFLEDVSLTVVTNDLAVTQPILAKDAQNNVYVSGTLYVGVTNLGAVAAKFDESGQAIWTNKIPKLFGTQPFISAVAKDGSMYIPGTTNFTAVVCKLDSGGAVSWIVNVKTNLNMITQVQAGATHSYVAGLLTFLKRAFVLLALNPDGTQAWTISIPVGSTVSDATCWLEVSADERIYLASRALKTLYAIDSSGNILWTNAFSTNIVADIKAGPENSLYVASQSGKAACSKYNAAGEKLWTTFLRRPSLLRSDTTDLHVDAFGNAYIVSSLASAVAKVDSDGNFRSVWSPVAEYPMDRQLQTTESGIAYMLRTPFDVTSVAKYDANGIRRWNRSLPGSFIDTTFIPVTDREVFVLTRGRLIKVEDLETPDMAQITAKIELGIVATNPVMRVELEGAAAQKVTWYLNGLPGGDGNATVGFAIGSGESIVPRFSGVPSYYAVEIDTENSFIATPDYSFDGVSIINDAQAVDGNLHFDIRGLATVDLRLQRSRDLINWEDYNTTTLDTNGMGEIIIPISNQEQTEYFRAIR